MRHRASFLTGQRSPTAVLADSLAPLSNSRSAMSLRCPLRTNVSHRGHSENVGNPLGEPGLQCSLRFVSRLGRLSLSGGLFAQILKAAGDARGINGLQEVMGSVSWSAETVARHLVRPGQAACADRLREQARLQLEAGPRDRGDALNDRAGLWFELLGATGRASEDIAVLRPLLSGDDTRVRAVAAILKLLDRAP